MFKQIYIYMQSIWIIYVKLAKEFDFDYLE